jgi:hypothetical protein
LDFCFYLLAGFKFVFWLIPLYHTVMDGCQEPEYGGQNYGLTVIVFTQCSGTDEAEQNAGQGINNSLLHTTTPFKFKTGRLIN